jgi:MSHA biogenesis protein MshJ
MKVPPAVATFVARYQRLTPRERVLIVGAVLAVILIVWDSVLMSPLDRRRNDLSAELVSLQESMGAFADAAEAKNASDPVNVALARGQALQQELQAIDGRLATESAGLIAPQLMTQVIHDVLSKQRGVSLVSLRNMPPVSLAQSNAGASGAPASAAGPYIHPVELVVEGRYLDVLAYLRELEALPYRFYWRLLELQTTEYPVNRVRIELGTLSMDREWIGI